MRSTRFDYSKTFGETKQIIEEKNFDQWDDILFSIRKNYRKSILIRSQLGDTDMSVEKIIEILSERMRVMIGI